MKRRTKKTSTELNSQPVRPKTPGPPRTGNSRLKTVIINRQGHPRVDQEAGQEDCDMQETRGKGKRREMDGPDLPAVPDEPDDEPRGRSSQRGRSGTSRSSRSQSRRKSRPRPPPSAQLSPNINDPPCERCSRTSSACKLGPGAACGPCYDSKLGCSLVREGRKRGRSQSRSRPPASRQPTTAPEEEPQVRTKRTTRASTTTSSSTDYADDDDSPPPAPKRQRKTLPSGQSAEGPLTIKLRPVIGRRSKEDENITPGPSTKKVETRSHTKAQGQKKKRYGKLLYYFE